MKVILNKLFNHKYLNKEEALEVLTKISQNEYNPASLSTGFHYVVSQSSITGKASGFDQNQIEYFKKIKGLNLSIPSLLGFGIYDKKTLDIAFEFFNGGIIGSSFIRHMSEGKGIS